MALHSCQSCGGRLVRSNGGVACSECGEVDPDPVLDGYQKPHRRSNAPEAKKRVTGRYLGGIDITKYLCAALGVEPGRSLEEEFERVKRELPPNTCIGMAAVISVWNSSGGGKFDIRDLVREFNRSGHYSRMKLRAGDVLQHSALLRKPANRYIRYVQAFLAEFGLPPAGAFGVLASIDAAPVSGNRPKIVALAACYAMYRGIFGVTQAIVAARMGCCESSLREAYCRYFKGAR